MVWLGMVSIYMGPWYGIIRIFHGWQTLTVKGYEESIVYVYCALFICIVCSSLYVLSARALGMCALPTRCRVKPLGQWGARVRRDRLGRRGFCPPHTRADPHTTTTDILPVKQLVHASCRKLQVLHAQLDVMGLTKSIQPGWIKVFLTLGPRVKVRV